MILAKKYAISGSTGSLSYIPTNMTGWWDGEYNAGADAHSATTNTWINLADTGSTYNATRTTVNWGANYAYFTGYYGTGCFTIPNNFQASCLGSEWTVEVCFQPDDGWRKDYNGIFGNHDTTTSTSSYNKYGLIFGQYTASVPNHEVSFGTFTCQGGTSIEFTPGSSGMDGNVWFDSAHVFTVAMAASTSNSSYKLIRNGITINNQTTTTPSRLTLGNMGSTFIGAAYTGNDRVFHGKIFCVRCYNRMLADDEIINNYIFDKSRFKIS